MKKSKNLERILNINPDLKHEIDMIIMSAQDARSSNLSVLCYCASDMKTYLELCDYLAARLGIPEDSIFEKRLVSGETRAALAHYIRDNLISIEKAKGENVLIKATGFVDFALPEVIHNSYILSRFGHDYDQWVTEDLTRELGRRPSKGIIAITHIDKSHENYQPALKTAISSQFKLMVIEF